MARLRDALCLPSVPMRGFQKGCALTTEAELRRVCPWGKQAPSLLWRSEHTKGLGGAQCQPWDMVFLGLHLLAGDGDLHPWLPWSSGHWAWTAMISLHFMGFGWRAETGLLSFYYCTSTTLIRQIPFLPLFFFFWGNCCWFFFYYIIYLFCLYKHAEDSAQQSVLSFDHVGPRD